MRVQNIPDYASDCKYIVAREYDGELWFWGAYDELKTAKRAAWEIDGEIVEVTDLIAA